MARVDVIVTDIPNPSMDILLIEYPELAMTLSEPGPSGVDALQIMIDMLPMPENWQNFDPETQELYREDAKKFLNAHLYSLLEGDLGRRPVDFDQIFKELGNGQRPYLLEVLFPTPSD